MLNHNKKSSLKTLKRLSRWRGGVSVLQSVFYGAISRTVITIHFTVIVPILAVGEKGGGVKGLISGLE